MKYQSFLSGLFLFIGSFSAVHASVVDFSDASMSPGRAVSLDVPHSVTVGALTFSKKPSGLFRAAEAVRAQENDMPLMTRGPQEVALFRKASPAVVLLCTDNSLGSGSLISADTILTNWHVVEGHPLVAVVFKPEKEGSKISNADIVPGEVIKVDETKDLALVKVSKVPSRVTPLALGTSDELEIGADVHAIGHPTGETWSYTKGIISQVRDDFAWSDKGKSHHFKAKVIQTQTPINPGNSGGPLLSDKGNIIGVNAFKTDGEGLNFAVAVGEVETFLKAKKTAAASSSQKDKKEPKIIFSGRNQSDSGFIQNISSAGDGFSDITILYPDDEKEPYLCVMDTNRDGKIDVWIFNPKRDGRWESSLYDTNFDGKPDLEGVHSDGKITPSRYQPYKEAKKK